MPTMNTNQTIIRETILKRRSYRAFSEKPLDSDTLQVLFTSAQWVASSFNEQPWRFVYASKKDDPAGFDTLLGFLTDANRVWAKEAPVLMAVLASARFAKTGEENRHAMYDAGQAMSALAIQAAAMDIYIHQMAGFDMNKVTEAFKLGKDFIPAAMVAIGYKGDPDQLNDELKKREQAERSRRPVKEVAFRFSENLTIK